MKRFTAILGLAMMVGGLAVSTPALALQAAAPAASTQTDTQTAAQLKAQKRADRKAAKEKAAADKAAAAPAGGGSMAAPAEAPATSSTMMKADKSVAPASGSTMTKGSKAGKPVEANATPAQIADAKAKGMVWVNTSSKVYHKSTDRYYGATKVGQFMTEADAQKAGAHMAK